MVVCFGSHARIDAFQNGLGFSYRVVVQKGFINNLASCSRRRAAVYWWWRQRRPRRHKRRQCQRQRIDSCGDNQWTSRTKLARRHEEQEAERTADSSHLDSASTDYPGLQLFPVCRADEPNLQCAVEKFIVAMHGEDSHSVLSGRPGLRCRETTQSINTASAFGCPCCAAAGCWSCRFTLARWRFAQHGPRYQISGMYLKVGG